MWIPPESRFKNLRRLLMTLSIAGPVLAVVAVVCWSRQIEWAAFTAGGLAVVCTLLLPHDLLRVDVSSARGTSRVEIFADLTRSLALILLFVWVSSLPEFEALLIRIFRGHLWDPQLLLAAGLWGFSAAYRRISTIRALNDRQLYRYYQGESESFAAEQTFKRIDPGGF